MDEWVKKDYMFEKMTNDYNHLLESFNSKLLKEFISTYILSEVNLFDELKKIPKLIKDGSLNCTDINNYIQLCWNLQTGDIVPLDIIDKGGRINRIKRKCKYHRCYQKNINHKLTFLHKNDDNTVLWVVGIALDLDKIKQNYCDSPGRKNKKSNKKIKSIKNKKGEFFDSILKFSKKNYTTKELSKMTKKGLLNVFPECSQSKLEKKHSAIYLNKKCQVRCIKYKKKNHKKIFKEISNCCEGPGC